MAGDRRVGAAGSLPLRQPQAGDAEVQIRRALVDASFLIPLVWPKDRHRIRARRFFAAQTGYQYFVTDGVISEVLARATRRSLSVRRDAVALARRIVRGDGFTVVPTGSLDQIEAGLARYERLIDHRLSYVDCVQMNVMDELGITEILTFDQGFAAEDRYVLLPPEDA